MIYRMMLYDDCYIPSGDITTGNQEDMIELLKHFELDRTVHMIEIFNKDKTELLMQEVKRQGEWYEIN